MNISEKYRLYARAGNTRQEMEKYQEQGVILLHEGLLHALEVGCKPHGDKVAWNESINKLEESCLCFLKAATPGLSGGFTSNINLAVIACLEATSIRADVMLITEDHLYDTQFAIQHFEAINEPIGIYAAKVIQNLNARSIHPSFPFSLEALLLTCATAINIERAKSVIERAALDISKFGVNAHAFPERDLFLLTLLHKFLPFNQWKYVFEEFQREELPHFELEISTILITFIIAVATAVSSNVISEVIKNRINDRKQLKENARQSIKESEIEEKLRYLLKGYALREYHLKHPEYLEREVFLEIWRHLRNNQSVPDEYLDLMDEYKEFQQQLWPELQGDADMLLNKLEDLIIDNLLQRDD